MRLSCPSCATEVESDPGELAACSACGHWWIAEEPDADDAADAPAEEPAAPLLPPGGPVDAPQWHPEAAPAAPAGADASPDWAFESGPTVPADAVPGEALPIAQPAPADPEPAPAGAGARHHRPIADLPRPGPTPEAHPWEFELQLGVGDRVQGPFDRMYLREHLYMGRLTGDERVRIPGAAAWGRLGDRPEFQEVLHLLGKDEPAVLGNKRIAGWQKAGAGSVSHTGSAPRPTPAASAAAAPHSLPLADPGAAAPVAATPPGAAAPAPGGKGPVIAIAIVGVVAVIAAIAGLVLTR